MNVSKASLTLALTTVLGTTGLATAGENPFALQTLSQGYMVADAAMKEGDGKTAEGKCGGSMPQAKDAEGKCGGSKTQAKDTEGKCGGNKIQAKDMEGKCGGNKTQAKTAEGKCGEGKCGGSKK